MSATEDRRTEQERYDREARHLLTQENESLKPDGAQSIPVELRAPYVEYENRIARIVQPGFKVLDICCGTGLYSVLPALRGGEVTATDIAPANLEVVQRRAARANVAIHTLVADAERLPFADHSFDVVTIANSLSYVDLDIFLSEVERLLRPGGYFVFVDSYNHNPIYRLNRYLHYLRGNRTRSTLERMPNRQTLALLRRSFPDLDVRYFGIGSFLMPLIRPIAGAEQAARFSDWLDKYLPSLKEAAFKIVVYGHAR